MDSRMEWNRVKNELLSSVNQVEIFEKEITTDRNDTRIEAIRNNTDSIVINKYLRLLGAGKSPYENVHLFNQEAEKAFGEKNDIVAYDAFGGLFAVKGTIQYFAPDTLEWENTEKDGDDFVRWLASGSLKGFYSCFLWDKSEEVINRLQLGQGILMYPFLWAKECDIDAADKKLVPYRELLELNGEFYISFQELK